MTAKRNGPEGTRSVPESLTAAKPLDCPQSTEAAADARTADAAELLADVWVVVVRVTAAHYRRRVFLSIAPAWSAARRAADKGYSADVVLCRLTPVSEVPR